MADEQTTTEEKPSAPAEASPERRGGTTLTGKELIVLLICVPLCICFLTVATKVVWAATSGDAVILDNAEGLIAILAVLSMPFTLALTEILKSFNKD